MSICRIGHAFAWAKGRCAIRNLTVDNPTQQRQLPALESLVERRIQDGKSVIALRRNQGLEAAANAVESGAGQHIMDGFEEVVQQMQNEELRLLALRDADAKQRLARPKWF